MVPYHGIGVNINAILTDNIKARTRILPGIEARKEDDIVRGEGRGASSGKMLPVPFAVSDHDSVTIASQSRALQEVQDRLRIQVPVAKRNILPVEEDRNETIRRVFPGTTVNSANVVTDSEIVRDSRTIGPFTLHVNSSAMKRYGEASSYRAWHSTTFELTV